MPEDRSILSRPGPPAERTVAYGRHPDQVMDIYPADGDGAGPTVVFVHGGYWRPEYDREHARSAAGALAAAGFPTALVEYRRIPGSPDATCTDVAEAVRLVASGGTALPRSPVVIVGHSAGGHLGLVAASDDDLPVLGCLALAPLADLQAAEEAALDGGAVRDFLGGPASARPDLDPARMPAHRATRTVVLHGIEDSVVPIAISQSYADATGAALQGLAGIGHFELIDPQSACWPTVIAHLHAIGDAAGIE